jgi:hypothetical protein
VDLMSLWVALLLGRAVWTYLECDKAFDVNGGVIESMIARLPVERDPIIGLCEKLDR